MSARVTSQLSVSSRWNVRPCKPLVPSRPPLITSTTADGMSFSTLPISKNRSTILISTLSTIFETKSRLSSESRLLSTAAPPPNSNEPYRTMDVGTSLAEM